MIKILINVDELGELILFSKLFRFFDHLHFFNTLICIWYAMDKSLPVFILSLDVALYLVDMDIFEQFLLTITNDMTINFACLEC